MKNKTITTLALSLLLMLTGHAYAQEPDLKKEVKAEAQAEVQEVSIKKEIRSAIQAEIMRESGRAPASAGEEHFDEALLIPIFGIIFTFGTPMVIVWLVLANGARRRRLLHETIDKCIAAGQPIPPELFVETKPKNAANNLRHKGLIMTFLGFALAITLSALVGTDVASVALIPFFIGLAYLVSWKFGENDKASGSVE